MSFSFDFTFNSNPFDAQKSDKQQLVTPTINESKNLSVYNTLAFKEHWLKLYNNAGSWIDSGQS
jgi:hypothetical protein